MQVSFLIYVALFNFCWSEHWVYLFSSKQEFIRLRLTEVNYSENYRIVLRLIVDFLQRWGLFNILAYRILVWSDKKPKQLAWQSMPLWSIVCKIFGTSWKVFSPCDCTWNARNSVAQVILNPWIPFCECLIPKL